MWRDKLQLNPGDTIRVDSRREKGHMGQEEITEASVLNADGERVGRVTYTEHTAIRGLKNTYRLTQWDSKGIELVNERWGD